MCTFGNGFEAVQTYGDTNYIYIKDIVKLVSSKSDNLLDILLYLHLRWGTK